MATDTFALLEEALATGGTAGGFAFLGERFRAEKNYPMLFEARLIEKRIELGIDPIQSGSLDEIPAAVRPAYERAFVDAARQTGELFLGDGDIVRAWPYFRAIGEPAPVAAAIENLQPGQDMDALIGIAFQERAHPRKGFELILAQHGLCRAITCFDQYPGSEGRDQALHLLVRTLYDELAAGLRSAIARREGEAPQAASLTALMEGRDWLFENNSYYTDSSHLISILRYSLDIEDPEYLRLALEMADYGTRLSPMFLFKVDPPFENVYIDHAVYLRGLLGQDVEAAIAHFRRKVEESDPSVAGTAPAQVLITLLVRLERFQEAIQASLAHLDGVPAAQLGCPSMMQLCQMAGDWEQLKRLARERGDVLSFAAAAARPQPRSASPTSAQP